MCKDRKPIIKKDGYKITVTLNGRAATYTQNDFAYCESYELDGQTKRERRENYVYSLIEELTEEGFPKNDARTVAGIVAAWATRG